ncbi:hypothetical protein C0J52_24448 [Blattella germanica]|nr:hypothetical protein C0J52_24448 [Blattella germanica]
MEAGRVVTAVANGLAASAADRENQTGPSHHQPNTFENSVVFIMYVVEPECENMNVLILIRSSVQPNEFTVQTVIGNPSGNGPQLYHQKASLNLTGRATKNEKWACCYSGTDVCVIRQCPSRTTCVCAPRCGVRVGAHITKSHHHLLRRNTHVYSYLKGQTSHREVLTDEIIYTKHQFMCAPDLWEINLLYIRHLIIQHRTRKGLLGGLGGPKVLYQRCMKGRWVDGEWGWLALLSLWFGFREGTGYLHKKPWPQNFSLRRSKA